MKGNTCDKQGVGVPASRKGRLKGSGAAVSMACSGTSQEVMWPQSDGRSTPGEVLEGRSQDRAGDTGLWVPHRAGWF